MATIHIRPYQSADRPAVRRICYETGFMGASIAPQYGDFESFADMFSGYYTDREPENILVAEQDAQLVGYALSALDARRAWDPMRIALKHFFTRATCFRRGTIRFYLRALCDTTHDLPGQRRPAIDLARYPSQVHVNLLPIARGGTVGKDLLFGAFDRLAALGSPGTHGESLTDNAITKGYWQKVLGVQIVGKPYPVPGLRSQSGARMRACLGIRDLSQWQIGVRRTTPAFRGRTPPACV